MKINRFIAAMVISLGMVGFVGLDAKAHPHVWIDLRTDIILDDQGRVAGLRLDWTLDELYSIYVIEDIKSNPQISQSEALATLAVDTEQNLAEYDYFVRAKLGDVVQSITIMEPMTAELRDEQLWMGFSVKFDQPIDVTSGEFRYSVFDPSYYIEISYPPEIDLDNIGVTPITFDGEMAEKCEFFVERAEPTFEVISLAASLDRDDVGPESLGDLFADWVKVSCP